MPRLLQPVEATRGDSSDASSDVAKLAAAGLARSHSPLIIVEDLYTDKLVYDAHVISCMKMSCRYVGIILQIGSVVGMCGDNVVDMIF